MRKMAMKNNLLFSLQSFLIALVAFILPTTMAQTARPSTPKSARRTVVRSFVKQNGAGRQKTPAAAIRAVLDTQVAAWNAGKLEEFMDGYWRSPNLTFFTSGRKLSGWDATLDRYRKTYQAEGKEMGKLAFSDLDIQLLGPDGAVVRGRFGLTLSDGKKLGGLYTLIFRRFNKDWKIIHDHTSSDQ